MYRGNSLLLVKWAFYHLDCWSSRLAALYTHRSPRPSVGKPNTTAVDNIYGDRRSAYSIRFFSGTKSIIRSDAGLLLLWNEPGRYPNTSGKAGPAHGTSSYWPVLVIDNQIGRRCCCHSIACITPPHQLDCLWFFSGRGKRGPRVAHPIGKWNQTGMAMTLGRKDLCSEMCRCHIRWCVAINAAGFTSISDPEALAPPKVIIIFPFCKVAAYSLEEICGEVTSDAAIHFAYLQTFWCVFFLFYS